MTARALRPVHLALAAALLAGGLTAITGGSAAADPADRALQRLQGDADRTLRLEGDAGDLTFVGVPARADFDNPRVSGATSPGVAADGHLARYGAAFGTDTPGTTMERTSVSATPAGDVVRYQQEVDGVPVLGGDVVVSLRSDGELSSILADTTDETAVAAATVSETAAEELARGAFAKSAGPGAGTEVTSLGRWVVDPEVTGLDSAIGTRTAWRFEVTRDADERRLVLIDDQTGGVLLNADLIAHALDRIVCDNNDVARSSDIVCLPGSAARTEASSASGVADVNTAFALTGAVAAFYADIADVDLTDLLGADVGGGVKKLASTVRWCYVGDTCPNYPNAFWNGTQMYYGTGFAGADDVVGHEITHGFTERNSGLFYWGQSGAINESISDIIGEIVDHRNVSVGDDDPALQWSMGEDIPGFPDGIRNAADPTLFNDPDKTSSTFYVKQGNTYTDNDGVHSNSGVGNKTFYLISQGGTFNGQTITGIDTGDADLTKSGLLWILVDESLTSGSDYADLGTVLDQSCQALLAQSGTTGFTSADCADVHKGTLATELAQTPTNNSQPADAEVACPSGFEVRTLFNSETGTPTAKMSGSGWARDTTIQHSVGGDWEIGNATTALQRSLTTTSSIPLPDGQTSYLFFQQWRVLEYDNSGFYDAGTVEIDDTGDASGPIDVAGGTWVNGPGQTIFSLSGNAAAGRLGFGGDSRGYVASRLDLSAFSGATVRPQFTLNTDSSVGFVGWVLDDIQVYTCDAVLAELVNNTLPSFSGTPRVGSTLTASDGTWTPTPDSVTYAWLRNGSAISGATGATYAPVAADVGTSLSVRVTASASGFADTSATSSTATVLSGVIAPGTASISGSPKVGVPVSAASTGWSPSDVTLAFQWLRNGSAISGATSWTYEPVGADAGTSLSVRVTATKSGFGSQQVTSAAKTVAKGTLGTRRPTISGKPQLGRRLKAAVRAWSPAGVTLRYQWLRNGKPIAKATGKTYKLVRKDKGKRISVRVTGVASGYDSASVSAKPTAKVKAKKKRSRR